METSNQASLRRRRDLDPASRLPKVWLSFIFVILPFILILTVPGPPVVEKMNLYMDESGRVSKRFQDVSPPHPMLPYAALSVAAGWFYWLFCVARLNGVLRAAAANIHSITPARAAWLHLVPAYNFYWIFRWPISVSHTLREIAQVKLSGGAAGAFLCFALLIVYLGLMPPGAVLGHAVALGIAAAVVVFMTWKVRSALVSMSEVASSPRPDAAAAQPNGRADG